MNSMNFLLTFIRFLLGALLAIFSLSALSQEPAPNHLLCGAKGSISERIKDCENYDGRFKGKVPAVIAVIQHNVNSRRFLLYYYPSEYGHQIWAWPNGDFSHAAATKYCKDFPEGFLSQSLKQFMQGDLEGKLKGFKFRLPGIDEISEIVPFLNENYVFINRDIHTNDYYEDVGENRLYSLWTHNHQWEEDGSGRAIGVPWLVSTLGTLLISGRGEKAKARCVWSNRRELADDSDY